VKWDGSKYIIGDKNVKIGNNKIEVTKKEYHNEGTVISPNLHKSLRVY